MLKIGYTLSSEEIDPISMMKFATAAEDAGFSFLGISDHYHPWVDEQGQSPFVWNVVGALSQITKTVEVFVEVNCPILRYHPAIVAQAAATSQYQLEGRFILGVGTGENLNEHIVGKGWPPSDVRRAMLEEAVTIMRKLWEGGYQTYWGKFFSLDAARIYTLPENTIPVIVSGMGPKATELAGKIGDGFVTTSPSKDLIKKFETSGGKGKPKFGQMTICFAKTKEKATEIMKKEWPLAGMPKPLNTELRLPKDFEATAQLVRPEDATKTTPLGADKEAILKSIKQYEDAGFTQVYIHSVGPNQLEFIEFAKKEILPNFVERTSKKQKLGDFQTGPVVFAHDVKQTP